MRPYREADIQNVVRQAGGMTKKVINNSPVSKKKNGGLPIGWEIAQVKDVCDIIRGVSYKKADSIQEAQKGYLSILRATNIQDNSLVLDKDLVYVPSNQVSENQRLKIGDIVIATSSGSKHLVGKTAQVKEKWYGAFGAFCAAIRSTVEIDYRYLGYFFNSPAYKDVIAAKAIGVNINNLRRGDIEKLKIPLAPLNEQKHIVAEIEKQFSRLDEAVDNLKRVKANLKRYKASVLKAAVEGKLTEEWRKKHPNVEPVDKLFELILAERRKKWEEAELAKMRAKGKKPKDDKWKKKYKEPAEPGPDDLPILLPILEEQKEIITILEEYMSVISVFDRQVDKNLRRAERLRQSILKKAFSGKLLKTTAGKGM